MKKYNNKPRFVLGFRSPNQKELEGLKLIHQVLVKSDVLNASHQLFTNKISSFKKLTYSCTSLLIYSKLLKTSTFIKKLFTIMRTVHNSQKWEGNSYEFF